MAWEGYNQEKNKNKQTNKQKQNKKTKPNQNKTKQNKTKQNKKTKQNMEEKLIRDRSLFLPEGAGSYQHNTSQSDDETQKVMTPFWIYKEVMTPLPHMPLSYLTAILSNSIIEI